MRDNISEGRLLKLHPAIRDEVRLLINKAEERLPFTAVRIVQGLRTFAEQDALYAQGRTKPGNRVTNARAGASFHNYGLAIDFALLYDRDKNGSYETLSWDTLKDMDRDGEADWMEVVEIFDEAGYTWGGRFTTLKDNPHLEKSFGFTWRQLLAKHNAGEFLETEYVIV